MELERDIELEIEREMERGPKFERVLESEQGEELELEVEGLISIDLEFERDCLTFEYKGAQSRLLEKLITIIRRTIKYFKEAMVNNMDPT